MYFRLVDVSQEINLCMRKQQKQRNLPVLLRQAETLITDGKK